MKKFWDDLGSKTQKIVIVGLLGISGYFGYSLYKKIYKKQTLVPLTPTTPTPTDLSEAKSDSKFTLDDLGVWKSDSTENINNVRF